MSQPSAAETEDLPILRSLKPRRAQEKLLLCQAIGKHVLELKGLEGLALAQEAVSQPYRPGSRRTAFGEWLYTRRKEMGLTQTQLALRVGVDKSSIAFYERGYCHPRVAIQERLCVLFKEDPQEVARMVKASVLKRRRDPIQASRGDEVLQRTVLRLPTPVLSFYEDWAQAMDVPSSSLVRAILCSLCERITQGEPQSATTSAPVAFFGPEPETRTLTDLT
jgi:transcriptional regulator with XRE-family HTH domain